MRHSELINLLPPFLRTILEYCIIFEIEESAFDELTLNIENLSKEVIIDKAKSYGLVQYEKIFNIINTTTDIEERRFNLKSKMINQLPFNMEWLNDKLKSLVGENNYQIIIENSIYKVSLNVSSIFEDVAQRLYGIYRQLIPANMELVVNLLDSAVSDVYISNVWHEGETMFIKGEV